MGHRMHASNTRQYRLEGSLQNTYSMHKNLQVDGVPI